MLRNLHRPTKGLQVHGRPLPIQVWDGKDQAHKGAQDLGALTFSSGESESHVTFLGVAQQKIEDLANG